MTKASGWMYVYIPLTPLGTSFQWISATCSIDWFSVIQSSLCLLFCLQYNFVSFFLFFPLFYRCFFSSFLSFLLSSFFRKMNINFQLLLFAHSLLILLSLILYFCLHFTIANVSHFNLIRPVFSSSSSLSCCFDFLSKKFIEINRFRTIEISSSSFSVYFIVISWRREKKPFATVLDVVLPIKLVHSFLHVKKMSLWSTIWFYGTSNSTISVHHTVNYSELWN